jgi:hypothetical protein
MAHAIMRPWKGAASTSTILFQLSSLHHRQSPIVILVTGMFKTQPKVMASVCTQKDKGTGSMNVVGVTLNVQAVVDSSHRSAVLHRLYNTI